MDLNLILMTPEEELVQQYKSETYEPRCDKT